MVHRILYLQAPPRRITLSHNESSSELLMMSWARCGTASGRLLTVMTRCLGIVQLTGGLIASLAFCLFCFSQDNEIAGTFLPTPNPGIASAKPNEKIVLENTAYNEAVRLYKKGKYAEAASVYKKACGHFASACTNLGFMYNRGQGVKLNHSSAADYYRRGCDRGIALGCTNLGIMYWNRDLTENDRYAVELFERGCRNGDSGACRDLGYMYKYGDGVPKDESRAVEEYQLADRLSRVHSIPIQLEDGLILISLNIQDESVLLIVDTGASNTALVRKFLPSGLGLRPEQKVSSILGSG